MVNLDYYLSTGYALDLLARSPYHKQQQLGHYFRTEILPPLWENQVKFYVTKNYIPTAMVTWAWLNEDVERDVHGSGRTLKHEEWNCGRRLFFNDWITPYGNVREVLHDVLRNLFPDEKSATSIRRNMDGSVRRICRWTGINARCVKEGLAL
ncbi:toxin-activating lysine-acyltransferase [uncultured Tateyamaria sp.]|uniref:toxin-activating lysine-acyltransferase n=1 Tax=uncultured Tateyamaria sp. TaxID=455651 RepID=UPI00261A0448|nr:toxin-activating lysine-acyltransferase [uncultured Tateyamaria sp.]